MEDKKTFIEWLEYLNPKAVVCYVVEEDITMKQRGTIKIPNWITNGKA